MDNMWFNFKNKQDFDCVFGYYGGRLSPVIRDLIEYYTDEILTNKFIFFRGYLKKILVKYFVCYTKDIEDIIYEIIKNRYEK